MARLDRVKNLTGLVEMFAKSQRLRKAANLVFVGGVIDPAKSGDRCGLRQCVAPTADLSSILHIQVVARGILHSACYATCTHLSGLQGGEGPVRAGAQADRGASTGWGLPLACAQLLVLAMSHLSKPTGLSSLAWTLRCIFVHAHDLCVCWRQVAQKDRVKNGELYRYIADNHGIFVQPAK
jgi:hypothetical protein